MAGERKSASDIASLSVEDRVDLICDDFDQAWQAGGSPRIEDYLEFSNASVASALFLELLLVEIEQRTRRGDPPVIADYLHRFPGRAEELEALWFRLAVQDTTTLQATLPPLQRFSPGNRIAQFELLEVVGSGGAGQVWKARDTLLQRTVAIKFSTCQLSEEALHRFLREGQVAAQMRHSHLVSVYEVGHDRRTAFIVSDFIEGQDLRAWLRKGRPDSQIAAQMVADLAEALHHSHEQGVIHRDLKPANVLLDQQERVHITDFGAAKWTSDERDITIDGQLIGTPAYMSPEQARGTGHRVDRRTDVYALGTLLYEMLTWRQPFTGDQSSVLNQIIHSEPRRPRAIERSVPRDLETICLKAMEKDPNRRYASAQEMAVDLRRYLRGDGILARPIGRLQRSGRWLRRRPAVAASILFGSLALGALGAVSMLAEENRQLLGLRQVSITTEPAGAKVTFVPLNEVTEEPMPEKMIHAEMVSPVAVDLRPGNYLVVAVLEDGRFHEVFRHVPEREENFTGHLRHLRWTVDEAGEIVLPSVIIPPHSVTDAMAFIQGTAPELVSKKDSTGIAPSSKKNTTPQMASLFIDFGEVTVGEYRRVEGNGPPERNWTPVPDTHALTRNYDSAVAFAEKVGKRLPTREEFQFVASRRGESQWPWGNGPSPEDDVKEFGPVGTPKFDRLADDPRVVGLVSNVAEWTMSSAAEFRGQSLHSQVIGKQLQSFRFVAGGDESVVRGNATVAPKHRGLGISHSCLRGELHPGLGFRCVRSSQPRNTPSAFD